MLKDANTIKRELAVPFAPEDLEWRLQQTTKEKDRGMAVAYVTNRAIQDRLDDVVGPENWHNDYKPWHAAGKKESQICGISIYNEDRKEWITKWDGAEDTDIEAIKGGLSDSMKRAAVQWGIGRYLYKLEGVWVSTEIKGNSCVIVASERAKLDKTYLAMLKKLNLTPAKPGGLQSELTPRTDGIAPQQPTKLEPPSQSQQSAKQHGPDRAPTPKQPERQLPPDGKVTRMERARPDVEYTVLSAKVQSGMSKNPTMSLTLQDRDGKTVKAFVRGSNASLVPGAQLYDVKLTLMQQNSVVFNVLEGYKILNAPQAA